MMTFNDIKIGDTIFVFNPHLFLTFCLIVTQIDKLRTTYCFKCYDERTSRITNWLIPQHCMDRTIYTLFSPNIEKLTKIKAVATKNANTTLRYKMSQ